LGRGVIRFNYLAPPRRFRFAATTRLAIDNRVRGPLAALMGTVVLTAALSAVQLERLHAARSAYERAAISFTAGEAGLRGVTALREEVIRRTQLDSSATAVRQASLSHADELIWIGNRLPARTWLRTLRYENSGYLLEGISDRAVGEAMNALHNRDRGTVPQLVSLQTDAGDGPARVRYTLRVDVRR
jgi:hypothetical protein